GKVFRQEEAGRRHNPEFTLLEWYRTGFSLEQLMDEVERLMGILLDAGNIPRFSYQQLFQQHLAIDPHSADDEEIKTLCNRYLDVQGSALDRTDYLQLLLAEKIEPSMPPFCFVYDFPAAQASLAAVTTDGNGQAVARRFELFGGGMELANGYFELTDATEQRRRFTADNKIRQQRGLPQYPIDENLLAALESGLPPCSGVAMGIDRVVMLACGLDDIGDSMAFPVDRI
ncbi:MAG: amino acid--tRNA ligase-related protein, partial [Gammaproteobacteria bacterium]